MENKEFDYRDRPSKQCQYPLETTPKVHYVSASHKAVELILINRFGKKNIPPCIWWRLKDAPKQIYGAQKYLWQVIRRLQKTYDGDTILSMIQKRHIKYLSPKMIARYLYWCKEEKDRIERIKSAEPRYNRVEPEFFDWTCPNCGSVHNQDVKHCPCKFEQNDNLLDWLDS